MDKKRKFFPAEDIGVIGSYSSFLALLLIATVLAFRHIFDYVIELVAKKAPTSSVETVFLVLVVIFGLIFLVVPSIPLIASIVRAFRERNHWLAWILVFIYCVYIFAVASQFIYELLVKLVKL